MSSSRESASSKSSICGMPSLISTIRPRSASGSIADASDSACSMFVASRLIRETARQVDVAFTLEAAPMSFVLELRDVSKSFGGTRALTGFSLKLEAGRIHALVGENGAGKSTLLNVLTNSHVAAQNRLFETLDTTSRRLRFPEDREVIITDTVGFIRDLPQELVGAFRTTLDELREADLLLHIVDINARDIEVQLKAVESILEALHLSAVPRWLIFNKCDQAPSQQVEVLCRRFDAIGLQRFSRPRCVLCSLDWRHIFDRYQPRTLRPPRWLHRTMSSHLCLVGDRST
ncbi:MAG: ATP-binding cassette domain-containing protein [Nitrospiraceae bacterium]|nr:ATP-binding cassette domain-containing protein [Nitrospiraceae bacterium]